MPWKHLRPILPIRKRQFNHTKKATIPIRKPVPLDPKRPSIAQLPDHVMRLILDSLDEPHPEETLNIVASLSSVLYEQARYVQHRVVRIDLDKGGHAQKRLDLIVHRDLLPAIRFLHVCGGQDYREGTEEVQASDNILGRLADLLPDMSGLRDLEWHVERWTASIATYLGEGPTIKLKTVVPIPRRILEWLPPRLRLHVTISSEGSRESLSEARKSLAGLANNKSLYALSIQIMYLDEHDCVKTMHVLKSVLTSCPNLIRLPVFEICRPPLADCRYFPEPGIVYCGLGLTNGERLPALEELGLGDYPWGEEEGPRSLGYPGKGDEQTYWVETFDWSHLTQLNAVPLGSVTSAMAQKLTSLRELQLDWYKGKAKFLSGLPSPLEALSIVTWIHGDDSVEQVLRFGASLKVLKIHQPEQVWSGRFHGFLSASELVQLSDGLPYLDELAIDVARDQNSNEWPYPVLDAITEFKSLRSVEIWLPLGGNPPARTPWLTAASARFLFDYLRARTEKLQRAIFHSGAPPYWHEGDEKSWAARNSITLVCNRTFDYATMEDSVRVTCLNQRPAINRQFEHLASQTNRNQMNPRDLDADMLSLKVALDGPLTKDEWDAWEDEQRIRQQKERLEQSSIRRRFIIRPLKHIWMQ